MRGPANRDRGRTLTEKLNPAPKLFVRMVAAKVMKKSVAGLWWKIAARRHYLVCCRAQTAARVVDVFIWQPGRRLGGRFSSQGLRFNRPHLAGIPDLAAAICQCPRSFTAPRSCFEEAAGREKPSRMIAGRATQRRESAPTAAFSIDSKDRGRPQVGMKIDEAD